MKQALPYFQNSVALAFALLGVVTAIGWARRRDRSLGLLALAIVLLSVVALLGRVHALFGIQPPLLSEVSLIGFMGSGYALFRFRGSLIPLSRRWRSAAPIATVVAVAGYLLLGVLVTIGAAPTSLRTPAAFVLIVVWSALVAEPIVRFWIVARGLPAVQAWRLRLLSLGFAGLVLILVIAIAAGSLAQNPTVQVGIELVALVIVPLLYVSFSPPSWLRRQWRASEEEGLQVFMRDLLLLNADPAVLTDQALEWAMRLAGGAAVVAFAGDGAVIGARGLTHDQIAELKANPAELQPTVKRIGLQRSEVTILVLPIASLGTAARLVVVGGPFTPGFGTDESNRVQQFVSAVVSALDRVRLLDELRAANVRLQEADRHKSVFLANMSHELRTPLNAILGFSELLIDSSNGQYPVETRTRFLEQINASGKHLLGLINDILDLSKVEAGQMELRLQIAPLAEIIDEVVRTVEPLSAKKEIRIQVETEGAGSIEADAGKLKQMVLNLVSNAIKFTPERGGVTIKALRHKDHAEVSVSDTGIGIADQDRARLFEPFQQVDSGADRHQPGTGLGLALTRRFARLHGGDVRLESQLGKGSVFTISLPWHAHQQGAEEHRAVTGGGGGSKAAPYPDRRGQSRGDRAAEPQPRTRRIPKRGSPHRDRSPHSRAKAPASCNYPRHSPTRARRVGGLDPAETRPRNQLDPGRRGNRCRQPRAGYGSRGA